MLGPAHEQLVRSRARSIPACFVAAALPVLTYVEYAPRRFSPLLAIWTPRPRSSIDLFMSGPLSSCDRFPTVAMDRSPDDPRTAHRRFDRARDVRGGDATGVRRRGGRVAEGRGRRRA